MITAGGTVVVDAKGRVWSIGADRVDDEHSEESPVSQTKPVQIEGLTDIVSAAPGIALRKDGQVFVWGKIYGRIRKNGQSEVVWSSTHPIPLAGASDAVAVASIGYYGLFTFLVVRKDGSVWVFGNNRFDALGFRKVPRHSDSDELILTLRRLSFIDKKIVRISTYIDNSIALAEDGTIYVWGMHRELLGEGRLQWGEDGFGGLVIDGGQETCDVVAGAINSFLIKRDGSVFVWGRVAASLLGPQAAAINKGFENITRPRLIDSVRNIVGLTSGEATFFLARDGAVLASGENSFGEIGIGSADPPYLSTPVRLPIPFPIRSINRNSFDLGAIDLDGRVWVWGTGNWGGYQGGNPTRSPSAIEEFNAYR